ncbi:MAG: hypothetical protein EBU84_16135, partial [Actinobacteria bacterium]|nr:hypothetical protein [Actinomycetota bacterium]
ITGGDGNPDVITLTAGGTDSVRYTADGDGGDAVDVITGFTTYTSSGTSTAAQSGYDKIVFLADGSGENADVFNVGSAVVFANTDATETTNGVVTTLASGDYTEFAGKSTAAGTGLADNKVNVITGRGYESIDAALDYNGVNSGTDADEEAGTLDDASMFVVFYNSASARTEMWYVADTDSAADDGVVTSTSTLMAYFTDITLTGIGGFGYQNFAVESGYI